MYKWGTNQTAGEVMHTVGKNSLHTSTHGTVQYVYLSFGNVIHMFCKLSKWFQKQSFKPSASFNNGYLFTSSDLYEHHLLEAGFLLGSQFPHIARFQLQDICLVDIRHFNSPMSKLGFLIMNTYGES